MLTPFVAAALIASVEALKVNEGSASRSYNPYAYLTNE